MPGLKAVRREIEEALYKTATETVKEELFSLCCETEVSWAALEELATKAMARCKGKVSVYGLTVFCDGLTKFSAGGKTFFHKSGLISGWRSWLKADFAAWTSWEGVQPVVVVISEDLQFSKSLSWKSEQHEVRILSVEGGTAVAVVDGENVVEPLDDILGFVAVQGLIKG